MRHRIEAAVAVFGTIALVYGCSRLIGPSKTAPVARTEVAPAAVAPPIVPRDDPRPPSSDPSPKVEPDFRDAVRAGDLDAAKARWTTETPLAGALGDAATSGNPDLVGWLLEKGADPKKEPISPLVQAVGGATGQGRRAIVEKLLAAGADPDAPNGPRVLADVIAQCSADTDIDDERCDLPLAKALADKGATVEAEDLLAAAKARGADKQAVFDALIAKASKKTRAAALAATDLPADAASIRKIAGTSGFRFADETTEVLPLVTALERGDADVAAAMLAAGAPATQTTRDGKTTLLAALEGFGAGDEQRKVVRALLARGADPNRAEPGGDMPLVKAVATGDVQIVVALLDAGARIDHGLRERDGASTALELADQSGEAKIARYLVTRGAKRRPVPKFDDER